MAVCKSEHLSSALRASAAALLLLAVTVPAQAISRVRSDQTSCASVQQTLRNEGAAILRYPSKRVANYFLYDRYVSPHYFCPLPEIPVKRSVPTADRAHCPVYRCERVEPLFLYPGHRD